VGERLGGLDAQPEVLVVEQGGEQVRHRGRGGGAQHLERLAGAVAGVEVGRAEHFDQRGHRFVALAAADGHGGAFADGGRPTAETLEQLLGARLS
jgi:hypothetical protein